MKRIKDFLSSSAFQWALAYLVFGIAGAVMGYVQYGLEGAIAAAIFVTLCVFAVQHYREDVKVVALLALAVGVVVVVGWLVYEVVFTYLDFDD